MNNQTKANERLQEVQVKARKLYARITAMLDAYQFDYTNVKLHDVAWKLSNLDGYTDERRLQLFEWFCEDEWCNFERYLLDNGLDREHVGRTSSFYIAPIQDSDLYACFYSHNNYGAHDFMEEVDHHYVGLDRADDIDGLATGLYNNVQELYNDDRVHDMEDYEDWINDGQVMRELDEISEAIDCIDDELKDVRDELDNVQAAYQFVEDYKKHQVAHFMYWLECMEEAV